MSCRPWTWTARKRTWCSSGEGQGGRCAEAFWRRGCGAERAKIEAVAMDMSAAYRGAVSTPAPVQKIIFDRFHCHEALQ